ncbi:twin-arginine translocase subunit TatC [Candidatus Persebacteraceae bacterium Df01]|uniref:Sec-independent protein translocase protein TatC n=1 Tax=Candidatus Doriopsillibacter californiensis TaxID=2970740 RepID=A0ABT7QK15_9GAMM|nr:twin-arginine translocase subunit TatC [Candidatus Persebacteraceae bacterium Df01]
MSNDLVKDGLLSHLIDLRSCLLRCIFAVLALMVVLFPIAGYIYTTLSAPLLTALPSQEMVAIGVLTPFTVRIVTAALAAILVALPYLWYEIWKFVAPGLYIHEKKLVLPLIVSSTLLFYIGMAFAYLMVFKVVFNFIASMGFDGVVWMPDIENFFSFAITLFIAFGVAFETPVVVYLLVRTGLVEIDTLRRGRRYFIVGAFVVAAIFTPPDIISQLLLAIPCWLLFELGLLLAPKKKSDTTQKKSDST